MIRYIILRIFQWSNTSFRAGKVCDESKTPDAENGKLLQDDEACIEVFETGNTQLAFLKTNILE